MQKKILVSLCLVCLLAFACGKSDTSTNRESTPATNSAAPATSPAAAPSTPAASTAKIGVAECDEYLAAYDSCISSKVPEAARAQYKTAIEQTRASWSKLAGNPATKASLAQACKTATETARTAMKSYGCTF